MIRVRLLIPIGCVIFTATANCLFTDAAGIKPVGSVSGLELKEVIGNQVALGFLLGCNQAYANKFPGQSFSCTDFGGTAQRDGNGAPYPSFGSMYFLAMSTASQNSGIDEKGFYKQEVADACAKKALEYSFAATKFYLESQYGSFTLTMNGVSSSDGRHIPATAFIPAVMVAANFAVDCNFEKTGKLVELGPLSL